jgi:hypothetical protein
MISDSDYIDTITCMSPCFADWLFLEAANVAIKTMPIFWVQIEIAINKNNSGLPKDFTYFQLCVLQNKVCRDNDGHLYKL